MAIPEAFFEDRTILDLIANPWKGQDPVYQEHGSAVPDTATGKQVSREAHRRRAGKTNKLALRQVEGQLCLDFG